MTTHERIDDTPRDRLRRAIEERANRFADDLSDGRIDLQKPSDVRAVRSAFVSVLASHPMTACLSAEVFDEIADQALGLIEEWFVGPTHRGGSP